MAALSFDYVIVGAGIVGLTVANELQRRHSHARIAILDKEAMLGMHASGRNSGVLHSGIYYSSDTLKARVCAEGGRRMVEFAEEEQIPYSQCGKLILATSEEQLPTVEKLLNNAKENRIPAERMDRQQLREIEPFAADGPAAIYCPTTAVIDALAVVKRLREKLEQRGVTFLFDTKVLKRAGERGIETTQGVIRFAFLYNCAGAYADTVAKCFELADGYALVPFKGIYWKLNEGANPKIKANIYPVPDVSLPFLGVHLTRVISGEVYVGPTAIPAFGRENYGKLNGIKAAETLEIGLRLAGMYLKNNNNFRTMAHLETAKYRKRNFLIATQRLVPSLKAEDMVPTPKAGIRPQLVDTKTGKLEMDYIIEKNDNSIHVLNAISPAFTSSFAFAERIVDEGEEKLNGMAEINHYGLKIHSLED